MTTNGSFLSDPGGVRRIATRWVICAELRLLSAAHFGGNDTGSADMVVIRDGASGMPMLPGSSLAGALRSHLADVLGGYRSSEHADVSTLFGGARGGDSGVQSSVIIFDCVADSTSAPQVEIRDGVQIAGDKGTAEDHKKYDYEIVPANTRFPVRFDLLVSNTAEEEKLLNLLSAALAGLAEGEIAIGMRRSRGLGSMLCEQWRARRFDLSHKQGWIEWALCEHERPIAPAGAGAASCALALKSQAAHLKIVTPPDERKRLVATTDLKLKSPMIVRSSPRDSNSPDVEHLVSGGRSVMPGSSLAGVLRAQAQRIASCVRDGKSDAARWVARLFGPQMNSNTENPAAEASRIRIGESYIENGGRTRTTRIAIDRFTQGVVSSALFDEEIESKGKVRVSFELRNPAPGELGLLVLLLKDLCSGLLPVGGSASVGRGLLEGSATIKFGAIATQLTPGKSATDDVEKWITEFWSEPSIGAQE